MEDLDVDQRKETSLVVPLLLSFLLANPVVNFLLTGSLWISVFALLLLLLIICLAARTADQYPSGYAIGVNFLVLASLFVHLEVTFRYGFSDYVIENLYNIKNSYYFNKPNLLSQLEDKEYSVTYKTNQQGLRIPAFANSADSIKSCDWLFLGDSFTQGAQVSFEELYTSRLYQAFPDKVIINAGISGFGIADEYHYFKEEGRHLAPKKVFLQLCNFNDFMNVASSRSSWSDYLMQYSDLARFLLYNIRYKPPGELPLGRWTEPFYPSQEDNATYNIFYKQSTPTKEKDIQMFIHYLSLLSKEVKACNAELVILLIPTKEQTYYRYLNEVLTSFKIPIQDVDLSRPNKLMRHWADSLGVELVDLLPGYQAYSEPVFFDYDEHLNPAGHQATAEILANYLYQSEQAKDKAQLLSLDFFGDRYPNFSRDSRWMTYQSSRDGTMELFLRNTEAQADQRITFNKVDESHPMLSPDGQHIVFTEGDPAEYQTRVTLMTQDGSQRRYVTDGADEYGSIATFSSSGRYLIYAGWYFDRKVADMTNPQIVRYDMATGRKETLTNNHFENWRPVLSPKEDFVVYISKRKGNFDLYRLDLTTGKEKQLTFTPYDEWDPAISLDGSRVVYAAHKDGNWDLFELSLNNRQSKQLTATLGDEWDPVYISTGNDIAYAGKFGIFQCIYRKPLPQPQP